MRFLIILLMSLPALPLYANSIGFTFNRVVDDSAWGLRGDYETAINDIVKVKMDGNAQSAAIYRATYNLTATVNLPIAIDINFNNTFKGYDIDSLGRINDIGAAFVVPVQNIDVSVGLFGRTGNPFGAPNARQTLIDAGYDEMQIPADLADLNPIPTGLSIEGGTSLNASLKAGFDVNRFKISTKALLELAGEGHRTHQLLTVISTSGRIAGNFNWQASLDLGLQIFDEDLEYETAGILTIGYNFE